MKKIMSYSLSSKPCINLLYKTAVSVVKIEKIMHRRVYVLIVFCLEWQKIEHLVMAWPNLCNFALQITSYFYFICHRGGILFFYMVQFLCGLGTHSYSRQKCIFCTQICPKEFLCGDYKKSVVMVATHSNRYIKCPSF